MHLMVLLFVSVAACQVENTAGDSFDLYYGLFMYNTNATEQVCVPDSRATSKGGRTEDVNHCLLSCPMLHVSNSCCFFFFF